MWGYKERDLVVEQIADSGAVLEPKLRRFGLICLPGWSLSFPPWLGHSCCAAYGLNASQSSKAYWAKIMGPVNWAKMIENTFLNIKVLSGTEVFFCKAWLVNPPCFCLCTVFADDHNVIVTFCWTGGNCPHHPPPPILWTFNVNFVQKHFVRWR